MSNTPDSDAAQMDYTHHAPADSPEFVPYHHSAGGWGALRATALALRDQSIVAKGSGTLLSMNQPDGFDCPGCAWPDPEDTSSFEFCENGVKAVAFEPTEAPRHAANSSRATPSVNWNGRATTGWRSRGG